MHACIIITYAAALVTPIISLTTHSPYTSPLNERHQQANARHDLTVPNHFAEVSSRKSLFSLLTYRCRAAAYTGLSH